jgi:hypothetical protein
MATCWPCNPDAGARVRQPWDPDWQQVPSGAAVPANPPRADVHGCVRFSRGADSMPSGSAPRSGRPQSQVPSVGPSMETRRAGIGIGEDFLKRLPQVRHKDGADQWVRIARAAPWDTGAALTAANRCRMYKAAGFVDFDFAPGGRPPAPGEDWLVRQAPGIRGGAGLNITQKA